MLDLGLSEDPRPAGGAGLAEVRGVVTETSKTAGELRALVMSVEQLLGSPARDRRLPEAMKAPKGLDSAIDGLVTRLFLYGLGLFLFFFVCLFLYRYFTTGNGFHRRNDVPDHTAPVGHC